MPDFTFVFRGHRRQPHLPPERRQGCEWTREEHKRRPPKAPSLKSKHVVFVRRRLRRVTQRKESSNGRA